MFSISIRESVSCPNCYVKSSSRCFYHSLTQLKPNASRPRPLNESESTQQVLQLPEGIVNNKTKQSNNSRKQVVYDDGSAAASSTPYFLE